MQNILVTRSSMPSLEEYIDEIAPLWDSHWLTNMGEKHIELQRKLSEKLQIDDIELFTNGHMALEMSLQSLDLRGEVITTPFTFISTTHAIVRNNLTPVFCDIRPDDFTIDTAKIEALITEKTCAILPVHVYGNICNIEAVQKIADRHGLKVIYDAAHAFGELYKGVSVGKFGDISCFSFHATKVFNTIEGGAACYRNKEIGVRLYQLKNFGIQDEETINGIGANAKMNEFCAAMGICNLRHIDEEVNKRKQVYYQYVKRLDKCDGIRINSIQDGVTSNYAYFPIIVEPEEYGITRDQLYCELRNKGVIARKYFYPLANECDCYKGRYSGDTPIAQDISNKVLTLPMYADLPLDVVNDICDLIILNGKRV